MNTRTNSLPYPFPSLANPEAVFTFADVRLALLSPRLVRIEISPGGHFEDRPSQVFVNRNQPLPWADIQSSEAGLTLETEFFRLTCTPVRGSVKPKSIAITIKETGAVVHLDDPNPGLLPGTARTLDETNGPIRLQPGVLSRSGWVLLDDTPSLVFNEPGWLEPRPAAKGYRDLYLLVSGSDFKTALRDYQLITGTPSLLPRYMLGNWWSHYWEYTQEEIQRLVERFKAECIPLSTLIIDMDWHITQTGNTCSGWTGFTWNRNLFPDPPALLAWLHEHQLATSLNLHPAEGIHPHEEAYPRAARALGLDPAGIEPIPFDIGNPQFAHVYFDELLHPLEAQGVDFWWIDWQQGQNTKIPGLDPLWWLNHLHYHDLARGGKKRPVIFSRWGGYGNHRYPIGFSGDTVVSWESLSYQPYFTACAANAAYGWWSHDIGGHMQGMENAELYTRWVQFGVLSPIFRLHCTKDIFINRHPWAFGAEVLRLAREAMQFRHALVPYLYTMARRNEIEGLPLVCPLYYDWPGEDEAYEKTGQYLFGTQLMAAPVTTPIDPDVGQSRQEIWFPAGEWFDFFTGDRILGGRKAVCYHTLEKMPLFARAGAIIPLQGDVISNGCNNPEKLEIVVFPGADGEFDLYEDDGISQAYREGAYAITRFRTNWGGSSLTARVLPAEGCTTPLPKKRSCRILFRGVKQPVKTSVWVGGVQKETMACYDAASRTYCVGPLDMPVDSILEVKIFSEGEDLRAHQTPWEEAALQMLKHMRLESLVKWKLMTRLKEFREEPSTLEKVDLPLTQSQRLALQEILSPED